MEEENKVNNTSIEDTVEKDINDELTIENMFKVYDKDAGTYMDLREIMDLAEEDFKDNTHVLEILK
jgi:hypothetical protein